MIIETERLILREYSVEDFPALHEIVSDPETMQHYPKPFDEERTKSWIEWNLQNYKEYGFGLWAVVLKETGEFVINLTTKDLAFATDYCGVKSGKKEDKFEAMNLTKEKAKFVNAPLIKESPVNIECEVTQIIPCGSHDMFLAKVLCVHADEQYMDETGRFDLSKANPLVYSHGQYYATGEHIGKFGYSVEKKKK